MAACAETDDICAICQSPLPAGTHRRLLKPPSPSTEPASRFLAVYVSPSLLPSRGERVYACKKCYAKLEKGCKTIDTLQQVVNELRGTLSLPPVPVTVTTAFSVIEDPTPPLHVQQQPPKRPQAPQIGGPPLKRAKRSLSFSPVGGDTSIRTVAVQTPEVKVTVQRHGQATRKFIVPKKYKRLVQSIRYRHSPYTVRTMLKSSPLKHTVMNQLTTIIRRECAAMCSRNRGDSVLRLLSVLELKDFSWKTVLRELKRKAPTLLHILTAASSSRTRSTPGIIGMAASLLLNGRNSQLCLPQAINSVVLYAGHSAKKVYTRLQKIGVCVSHRKTTQLIQQLGDHHDATVLKWRQMLECPVEVEELSEVMGDENLETESSNSSLEMSPESPTNSSSGAEGIETTESESVVSSSEAESLTLLTSTQCTYIVVGDNLDKTISPRYMRSDYQRQSIHYFHMYAALDRINAIDLPTDHPLGDISLTPLSAFLPSPADCKELRANYAVLLGRIVVKKLSFFKVFEDCVVHHITHKHSDVMKQKSVIVPLGILPKNENLTDELLEILKVIQQKYIPVDHQGDKVLLQQTALAGDQLTAARARKTQSVRVNSKSPADALRGLAPFSADWHAKVNFMEIIWSRLYSTESSIDGGTLHQLRNLINRVNVGQKQLKHQVNEVEDFLELVIACHLISAAMHFFGMKCVNDTPRRNGFSDLVNQLPQYQRQKVFFDRMAKIVDEYVVPQQFSTLHEATASTPVTSLSANPHVSRIAQEHSYGPSTASEVRHRQLPSSVLSVARCATVSQPVRRTAPDSVLNYASAVLNDGLLLLEFKDAIREGDGNRILRCWKVLLMYYRMANHTNYASEAFQFIAQVTATASPRVASQLLWSRVVNTKGKEGHNVPVDLHMEHLNRTVKEYVAGVGANVSQSTIIQCGQSLDGIMTVTRNYDRENNIHPSSGEHTKKSENKDEELILQELNDRSRVFDYVPGRAHSCKKFITIEPNVATKIDKVKLFEWLAYKKKAAVKSEKFSRLFGHSI